MVTTIPTNQTQNINELLATPMQIGGYTIEGVHRGGDMEAWIIENQDKLSEIDGSVPRHFGAADGILQKGEIGHALIELYDEVTDKTNKAVEKKMFKRAARLYGEEREFAYLMREMGIMTTGHYINLPEKFAIDQSRISYLTPEDTDNALFAASVGLEMFEQGKPGFFYETESEARDFLEKAIALNPSITEAQIALATIDANEYNIVDAANRLTKLLETSDLNQEQTTEVYYQLGHVYRIGAQQSPYRPQQFDIDSELLFASAERYLTQAMSLDRTRPETALELCKLYASQENYSAVAQVSEQAKCCIKNCSDLDFEHANALFQLGDYETAYEEAFAIMDKYSILDSTNDYALVGASSLVWLIRSQIEKQDRIALNS